MKKLAPLSKMHRKKARLQIPKIGTLAKSKHMAKNPSITLGDHFDHFIQETLQKGRYKNASEIVRAGLRLLEEEEHKMLALRQAIAQGIESGTAKEFNPVEHLNLLKSKRK